MRRCATLAACVVIVFAIAPAFAQQPTPPYPQPVPPAPQPQPPQPAPTQPPPGPPPGIIPGVPQLQPSSLRIVPGASLAGITVGSGLRLILSRFGRPSDVRDTSVDTVYTFSKWGIVVYIQGGKVSAASTTNSLLKLSDELGVGYRVDDVLRVVGRSFREGTVENFPGMIYDDQGIAFGLDRTGVAVVIVFARNTASRVSALFPGGAAPPAIAGFPQVAGLRPYSAETNYLSLPGYLRWIVYPASGVWITYAEAARVVQEQQAASR
jgi:hypothetical protein